MSQATIEEMIGKMIISFPDNADEVANLQIKELFNDENIFDYDGDGWNFDTKEYLEKYPNIKDAEYYLNEIQTITAIKTMTDDCKGFYSGCGCVICEIRDKRGDKRRRVR